MDTIKIKNLLQDVLTEGEIKFYLQALGGVASIQEISKKIKLNRSGCYEIMESLTAKGLVSQEIKQRGRIVVAEHPDKLVKLLGNKQRKLRRNELELKDYLPELLSVFDTSGFKPKVKFYEGKQGYKTVAEDALNITSEPKELLVFINTDAFYEVIDLDYDNNHFIPERIKRNILGKGLIKRTPQAIELTKQNKKSFRETKFIPEDIVLSITAYIYQNKVAIFTSKKELSVLLIESQEIYEFFRSLFYNIWNKVE